MSTLPLPGIEHVVLLMLENRSFDNVLGGLGQSYSPPLDQTQLNGLTGTETNPFPELFHPHNEVSVFQAEPAQAARKIPAYDPGEEFTNMSEQLYGYDASGVLANPPGGVPNMQGFAINYYHYTTLQGDPSDVMQYFNPEYLPITSALARAFAVSDTWYGSAPCQTYANRVFSICGLPAVPVKVPLTHDTYVVWTDDIEYVTLEATSPPIPLDDVVHTYGSVDALSIFQLFDLQYPNASPPSWKIYFHDTALSSIVTYVDQAWDAADPYTGTSQNVTYYDASDYPQPGNSPTFAQDVANDTLPMFSIIEPRYHNNWSPANLPPNSNHPGNSSSPLLNGTVPNQGTNALIDVADGEALLADVFVTLYMSPQVAQKTLLIVTYDEHGGVYDHVPPPIDAPSPFPGVDVTGFDYTMFGPRVPAIFINPFIAPGTVFRPQDPNSTFPVFDHTSILRTLREQFGLTTGPGSPPTSISQLTDRDGQMPDLSGLITLQTPRTLDDSLKPEAIRAAAAALAR